MSNEINIRCYEYSTITFAPCSIALCHALCNKSAKERWISAVLNLYTSEPCSKSKNYDKEQIRLMVGRNEVAKEDEIWENYFMTA